MNPWVWRLVVIILAVAFLPIIVSGTATMVTKAVEGVGETINSLIRPLSMRGDARLEGLIRLCLYLISITLLIRFLFGRRGGD